MKSVIIYSGGLDSTVCLYWALQSCKEVMVVNFKYGSNHQEMESRCAKAITSQLGIPLTVIPLEFIKEYYKSSLLGGKIPDGRYTENNMNDTVVPFRNGVMLSIAAGIAESFKYDTVVLGNHSGDHFIYPDCREAFINNMNLAIKEGTTNGVAIVSPFCNLTKKDIVLKGVELKVPFDKTYSCYKGGSIHCGVCGTCLERKQAFIAAGVFDPTVYEK